MIAESEARIVSYTQLGEMVCASAAKISTTPGNALSIFENSKDTIKNRKLIEKVLKSGHETIIEHMVFTIAFNNVSVFVEQYLIESRLASFTVKSRRYVDFSNMGYYVPENLGTHNLELYRSYMDTAFDAYSKLISAGIPKEDARFILPYSFFSNFYCTLNARELLHVIKSIKCGRGKGFKELEFLANQLIDQLKELFPCLLLLLDYGSDGNQKADTAFRETHGYKDCSRKFLTEDRCGIVSLLQEPADTSEVLRMAAEIGMCTDVERQRYLEQLSYTFLLKNVSLSGITHLTRHRMQSLMLPPITGADYCSVVFPNSIANDGAASLYYKEAVECTGRMLQTLFSNSVLLEYSPYFALSGNTMNVMTTINARELSHFIRLRSCKRAQWEIQSIAVQMLKQLRRASSEVFDSVGPSCYMIGRCPEGRMTCGSMTTVVDAFQPGRL